MKIKVKDKILVTTGKDKGKVAPVINILNNKIKATGINIVTKHIKPKEGVKGGIVKQEKAINSSNVRLICPECQKTIKRVSYKIIDKKKLRYCKECQKTFK